MAKGADAKIDIANRIAKALGDDWIGEVDKKYYVWGNENGEKIQICIALTCPKTPVSTVGHEEIAAGDAGVMNFEDMPPTPQVYKPAEITQTEIDNLTEMMKRLGL